MIINKIEFKSSINDILIIILIIFVFSVWFYSIQSTNLSQGETVIRIHQNLSKVHQSLRPYPTEIERERGSEREREGEIINLLSTVYTDLFTYKRDFHLYTDECSDVSYIPHADQVVFEYFTCLS